MESKPPEDSCLECATAANWPVEAIVMPAQSLKFPDHYLTQSFNNFFISHHDDNHDPAAKQVYRTLKPGGTAIVSTWAAMAHGELIKESILKHEDLMFPPLWLCQYIGVEKMRRRTFILSGDSRRRISKSRPVMFISKRRIYDISCLLLGAFWGRELMNGIRRMKKLGQSG
ncbi:hypothetical protein BGAL_0340g00050 [Botrytis galanthina]|uniref:Methyltransferase type 11 domain-containing protein n=1 Tax=Botrytis galanthina TaxID=278940 RepID=A0A4S8QU58_9HELO|nr:hypothetical protein BGAL_0340g00050 [Botrytis galanthina]